MTRFVLVTQTYTQTHTRTVACGVRVAASKRGLRKCSGRTHASCGHARTPRPYFPPINVFFLRLLRLPTPLREYPLSVSRVPSLAPKTGKTRPARKSSLPGLVRGPWWPLPFLLLLFFVFLGSGRSGRIILENAEKLVSESVRHLSEF